MKIIRNSIIPIGKSFGAINLFGILFVKKDMCVTPQVINHEMIHTAQIKELLYLPFYLIYVGEWLLRLLQYRGCYLEAYRNISFEKEAYANGDDLGYLKHRRRFAQWRMP